MVALFLDSKTVRITASSLVIFLAIGVITYSLVMLIRGVKFNVYGETPPGAPPNFIGVEYIPSPAALIPLLAATLIIIGILAGKYQIAWLGWTTLILFAAAFVFGIGGVLVPAAGLILVLLALIQLIHRPFS